MKPIDNMTNNMAKELSSPQKGGQAPDQKAFAREVETVFLNEFLKIMMEQTSFGKDKVISSFMPLITTEIARSLAERGMGIGDFISKGAEIKGTSEAFPIPESSTLTNRGRTENDVPDDNGNPAPDSERNVILRLPVEGRISSGFGLRHDPIDGRLRPHHGMDIAVPEGTPVAAAASGIVIFSGYSNTYGNCIIVKHEDGRTTLYAHNAVNRVKAGDSIKADDIIALSGSTGKSTGPHLHFEVRKDGVPINPMGEIG